VLLDLRSPNSLFVDPTEWPRALVVFIHRTDIFGGVYVERTEELTPQDEIPGDPESLLGRYPCSAYLLKPYDPEGLFADVGSWRFHIETWVEVLAPGSVFTKERPQLRQQEVDLEISNHNLVTVSLRDEVRLSLVIPDYDPTHVPRVRFEDEDDPPSRYERLRQDSFSLPD